MADETEIQATEAPAEAAGQVVEAPAAVLQPGDRGLVGGRQRPVLEPVEVAAQGALAVRRVQGRERLLPQERRDGVSEHEDAQHDHHRGQCAQDAARAAKG